MKHRILKFRAWDIKTKVMRWVLTNIHWLIDGRPISCDWCTSEIEDGQLRNLEEGGDQFILEEFTGLYDKNKKEIYEGDLIRNSFIHKTSFNFADERQEEMVCPGYTISKVIFEDGKFQHVIVKQKNSYFGELPSKPRVIFRPEEYSVVISNIHDKKWEHFDFIFQL